jgi:hypothetical protein
VARSPKRQIVEGILSAASDYIPDAIETPLRRVLGTPDFSAKPKKSLAAKPKKSLAAKPKALPAPPKPLALPAPGPGLPPFAVKTKGGQWWSDRHYNDGRNRSPEYAARSNAEDLGSMTKVDPELPGPTPAQQWLERALTKYFKNEFGTPEDPLRDLAARGLHYDAAMTPDDWKQTVDEYLMQRDIGHFTVPNTTDDFATDVRMSMPWLAKQPVTDKIYGILGSGPYLGHFNDEFANALMRPEASGLPLDLAVRPESLARMTFPQAVEHVGKINQFRAKEMLRAGSSTLNNPAVQTFKEYADDNPMGLRWVQLKAPDDIPEGYSVRQGDDAPREGWFGVYGPDDQPIVWAPTEDQARRSAAKAPLQQALKYEGDTMGHCVGGYCDDVMSGNSRIFSLRDAKGEPHVTIETSPGRLPRDLPKDVDAQFVAEAEAYAKEAAKSGRETKQGAFDMRYNRLASEWRANQPRPADEIVQIKGKQNAKPKDTYLPFVQDFVKGGQWSNVGDIRNTGLVSLPDGRYITPQQAEEVISAIPETTEMVRAFASRDMVPMRRVYDPTGLDRLDPEEWQAISQYFEGYAIGGRVDANRCFSYNPLTVKRGR